jgi:hypothetical protein
MLKVARSEHDSWNNYLLKNGKAPVPFGPTAGQAFEDSMFSINLKSRIAQPSKLLTPTGELAPNFSGLLRQQLIEQRRDLRAFWRSSHEKADMLL